MCKFGVIKFRTVFLFIHLTVLFVCVRINRIKRIKVEHFRRNSHTNTNTNDERMDEDGWMDERTIERGVDRISMKRMNIKCQTIKHQEVTCVSHARRVSSARMHRSVIRWRKLYSRQSDTTYKLENEWVSGPYFGRAHASKSGKVSAFDCM